MAGLEWTKKHVSSMIETLDADHADVESAAIAALDAALDIIETRAKYAVVGQVVSTLADGPLATRHEQAVKVCLGLYETDTRAYEAAGQLSSNAAGDGLSTWVVPLFFGTPAAWGKDRRAHYATLEAASMERRAVKIQASIAKRAEQAAIRSAEIKAMEDGAEQHWPCPSVRVKAGDCRHDPSCK